MSKVTQSLDLRQSQTLIMTPQLQQAIKMLQLNNLEMAELVEKEMAHNPFLEMEEPAERLESDAEGETDTVERLNDNEKDEAHSHDDSSDFDSGTAHMGSGGDIKFGDGGDEGFETRMSHDVSLREHLSSQLKMACSDARDLAIGSLLIDQLDASGYLPAAPDDLSERFGCSEERVQRLLDIVKGFDPTGVFASGLGECLALQLSEKNALDAPMQVLLDNLDLLGKQEFKKLADLCGVNDTYLKDMIEEVRALNPKPAADYDHFVVQTVIPDVLMKRRPKNVGGGWRIELNAQTLPKVLVNEEYVAEISASAVRKKDKEYVSQNLSAANWLVRAMDQRAQTILKVASEIIEEQDAFFNYGIEFLKPLKLKDIADKIDMHESTVSRVTTGKYMGTPRGLLELKFFFTTGLESADGQVHSSESIKARIEALTDAEDPKKILSDDKLVALLKDEGIDVARRTVAKYREAIGIGSSVERRRQKKAQL